MCFNLKKKKKSNNNSRCNIEINKNDVNPRYPVFETRHHTLYYITDKELCLVLVSVLLAFLIFHAPFIFNPYIQEPNDLPLSLYSTAAQNHWRWVLALA